MAVDDYDKLTVGTGLPSGAPDGAGALSNTLGEEERRVAPREDYGAMAGAGLEGVDASDFGPPPWIRPLHYVCPELTEGDAKFIEGAKPGMIMHSGTGAVIDGKTGGTFLPVRREHCYLEFIPRDAGGGFVSRWEITDPRIGPLRQAQGRFGKLTLDNGNEVSEAFNLAGIFVPPGGTAEHWRVMVGFSSTQIKKYTMLMQRLKDLIGTPKPRYPIWAHAWHLSTQPESNKKGKFFGWRFTMEGGSPGSALLNPQDQLVLEAHEFYEQLTSGAVRVDYGTATDSGVNDEEIPF